MEYVKYRLTLDMTEEATQYVIPIKTGDNARQFDFVLTNKGKPYKLEGCTAVFRGLNPDGTVVYNNCTISNNVITYTLTTATSSQIGLVECELTLYGADEKVITSPRFSLVCGDKVYSDEEVEGSDEFGALVEAMIGCQNLNVSAEKDGNVTTITITKKDGTTHTAQIEDGADGAPGADGYSPTVSITEITGGHTITITDADGSHTFDVMDGETGAPGLDGADGYSPTVTISTITGGHRVTITDAEGPHSFNVMDGQGGSGESLPVFVINWYSNPTEAQKTNIVGTFARMSAIAGKKYICYLHIDGTGRYLAAEITYVSSTPSYSGISFIEWVDHTRGVKYTISAASVDTYSQSSTTLYEEEDFDPQGNKPALQSVTADYVDGKLDDLSIPTKTSDLANDSGFVTSSDIANKADKPSIVTSGTNITLVDNTEYRLTNVSDLTITYPTGDFECFIRLTTAASGTVTITLPTSQYIGTAPTFGNDETWELSIKDGVVVAGKAVSAS